MQYSSEKAQRLWSLEQLVAADPCLTPEDRVGLRLLRMMENLREIRDATKTGLIVKGITSFGLVQNTFVYGSIEELSKVKNEMQIRSTVLRTEASPCRPLQIRNDLFEMKLQAQLFNQLITKDASELMDTFAAFNLQFGRRLDEIIADSAFMTTGEKVSTLEDIVGRMSVHCGKLAKVSKIAITCKNGEGIITCRHISKVRENDLDLNAAMEYWKGQRRPKGVTDIEEVSSKCDECHFEANCGWVESNVRLFVGGSSRKP